jgi:hypothetical protein
MGKGEERRGKGENQRASLPLSTAGAFPSPFTLPKEI